MAVVCRGTQRAVPRLRTAVFGLRSVVKEGVGEDGQRQKIDPKALHTVTHTHTHAHTTDRRHRTHTQHHGHMQVSAHMHVCTHTQSLAHTFT